MDFLQAELAKLKQDKEKHKEIASVVSKDGRKKYVRRGDILAKQAEEYQQKYTKKSSNQLVKSGEEGEEGKDGASKINDSIPIEDVQARLRALRQPIT